MDTENTIMKPLLKSSRGGGLFGYSTSFGGVIKKTKISEANLIKNYESMEKAIKDYNNSFKEHITNLNKLDDYANFSGMRNLFQKVIMKDVITQGAKVDTSMPLLFRNYHIEKEPTPSAFRREHILNQVRYILSSSFAGREHMLIKYMSVEIGRSQFILHITTIENIKKNRTLEHNGYVIDAGGTRAALKDILSSTKKNLKRRTALVEIGRGSSSSGSRSKTKTKKSFSSGSMSILLKSKKHTTSRSKSGLEENNDFSREDIGNSKELIKSLELEKRDPSNKLSSSKNLLKSMKLSSKQSKPSIYKRPSEKRGAVISNIQQQSMVTTAAGTAMAPGALPPASITTDFAARKQEILGGPPQVNPFQPIQPMPLLQPQQTSPQGKQQQPPQQKTFKKCSENLDAASCQADQSCFWDTNYQTCKFNRPRNGRPPGPAPGLAPNQFNPYASPPNQGIPNLAIPSAAPVSPPPIMEAI